MHRLKQLLRCVLAYTLYYTGLLWLYANFRLRRRAVVLMYHRVLPPQADTCSSAGIIVSPSTFELQMRFLKRHFRILTLARFHDELTQSAFGKRSCLVTFDDGWRDNATHALPVLCRYKVPVTIFVATGYIDTADAFWQERMRRLLFIASRQDRFGSAVLHQADISFHPTCNETQARRQAENIVAELKNRDRDTVARVLADLQSALEDVANREDLGDDRFMSWDDLRTLVASGLVTIGSHAHSHSRLPSLGYTRARQEFERSLQTLHDHGIADVLACAYPNGDVTDPVEAAATDAGFRLGFSTKSGTVAHASEAMHVRRINVHEFGTSSEPEFLYRILGLP